MTEQPVGERLADALIDSRASATLISWEHWVRTQVDAAVDAATGALGFTARALRAATAAVTRVIGQAAAAAFGVGQAIVASARALLSGRRTPARPAGRRGRRGTPRPRRSPRAPRPDLARPAAAALEDAARAIEAGADPPTTFRQVKARLRGAGASAVNQAAAAGSVDAAARLGAQQVMWVAERDACLTCTALSGETAPITGGFSADITYGDRPLTWAQFTGFPPRHPHCRCRVLAYFDGDQDRAAADALKREARRSVVRGWSLPSESEAARLRAAQRLLRRGAGLPRSVERYGAAAVAAGRFPRGRTAPTADPSRNPSRPRRRGGRSGRANQ